MLECGKMMEMVDMSDITRIMTRLLLKVEKWGQEQGETLPFSQGVRRFSDLLSHSDKIEEMMMRGEKSVKNCFISFLILLAVGNISRKCLLDFLSTVLKWLVRMMIMLAEPCTWDHLS